MNTSTLTINIPEGHKVGSFDEKKGVITFVKLPEDIKERVKTVDDAKNILGDDADVKVLIAMEEILPSHHPAVNYQRLVVIAKALNEGWVPDWKNGKWDKWHNWFTMGDSSGSGFAFHVAVDRSATSNAGSRLCFKSKELAEYAANQFFNTYKNFLILNNN